MTTTGATAEPDGECHTLFAHLFDMSVVEQELGAGAVPRSIEVIEAEGASWAGMVNAATAALIDTIAQALVDNRWYGPGFSSATQHRHRHRHRPPRLRRLDHRRQRQPHPARTHLGRRPTRPHPWHTNHDDHDTDHGDHDSDHVNND